MLRPVFIIIYSTFLLKLLLLLGWCVVTCTRVLPTSTSGFCDVPDGIWEQRVRHSSVWKAFEKISWLITQKPGAAALKGSAALQFQLGLAVRYSGQLCVSRDSKSRPGLMRLLFSFFTRLRLRCDKLGSTLGSKTA